MITYFVRKYCNWVKVTTSVAEWARLPHVHAAAAGACKASPLLLAIFLTSSMPAVSPHPPMLAEPARSAPARSAFLAPDSQRLTPSAPFGAGDITGNDVPGGSGSSDGGWGGGGGGYRGSVYPGAPIVPPLPDASPPATPEAYPPQAVAEPGSLGEFGLAVAILFLVRRGRLAAGGRDADGQPNRAAR
jgi:hypothetical protein